MNKLNQYLLLNLIIEHIQILNKKLKKYIQIKIYQINGILYKHNHINGHH